MNAAEILLKAIECDQGGRILQAQYHYQHGIQLLMDMVNDETDTAKKKVYHERIKEYIDRLEQIQEKVKSYTETGTIVAHIPIYEDSTGHSYNTLFGEYMNAKVKEILLFEPYLVERFQWDIKALINFFANAMNAPEILMKAIECDKAGRILEAQYHYQHGVQVIMSCFNDETDAFKKGLYQRLKQYEERQKHIQKKVIQYVETGSIVAHIPIYEDSTGHSYNSLFGEYMKAEVREILLVEPYLMDKFQFQNLVAFLELAVKNCTGLKYIGLMTKRDLKNPDGQATNLKQMKDDLSKREISMSISFDSALHDRKIVLSNGYIIKIGRGLHYFKATNPLFTLGLCDNDFRMCRQTDVDIWQTKAIS